MLACLWDDAVWAWLVRRQVVAFEQKMAELQVEINRKMEAERRKQEAIQRCVAAAEREGWCGKRLA